MMSVQAVQCAQQICKLGIFPGYFVDFCIFERTGFVLRFGDFVFVERADFCPQKILNLKVYRTENCVSCAWIISL
jgi:hypothetical protein